MTATVVTAKNEIETLWEGLTPPDRTTITYHKVDGRRKLKGTTADRTFWFEPSPDFEIVAERGIELSQHIWVLRAVMRLSGKGRSFDSLFDIAANESNLIARNISGYNGWSSGVLHVWVDFVETTPLDDESGDLDVAFSIRVLTEETD